MILADTSVWIDHLDTQNPKLAQLLDRRLVLMHPFVLGELSLGSIRNREAKLNELSTLPRSPVARDNEVSALVERAPLWGSGVGFVDAHLLASVLLMDDVSLWTRDKRLHAAASRLGLDLAR